MTFVRSFVTIGAHHHGPHVDALYALAERCGAEVIVVDPNSEERLESPSPPPTYRRAPYAGQEFPEGNSLKVRWEQL